MVGCFSCRPCKVCQGQTTQVAVVNLNAASNKFGGIVEQQLQQHQDSGFGGSLKGALQPGQLHFPGTSQSLSWLQERHHMSLQQHLTLAA